MTTYKIDAINQWELGSTVAKCKEAIRPLKNKNMFTFHNLVFSFAYNIVKDVPRGAINVKRVICNRPNVPELADGQNNRKSLVRN